MVAAVVAGTWSAWLLWTWASAPGRFFDRFKAGDCYVLVFRSGKVARPIYRVLGKEPNGPYRLLRVGDPESKSFSQAEEDFRKDEVENGLHFRKVACPQ